jgi:hypothetical protein
VYDLIVDMKTVMLASGGSKYMPDVVLAPFSVINQMKLKKDANNNYILPPFVDRNGEVEEGMTVIESEAIPANHLLVVDRRMARIYEKNGFVISKGYGTTTGKFEEDEMLIKVRKRLALLIRNADKGGILVCKDVPAALTTLAS